MSKRQQLLVSFIVILITASTITAVYFSRTALQPPNPDSAITTPQSSEPISDKVQTPLQQSLQDSIDKLEAEGKPHPKVTFESSVIAPSQSEKDASIQSKGSFETKVVAKTTVEYSGPAQAGKSKWDDIIIQSQNQGSSVRENGTALSLQGNLTQMLIDKYPQIYGEGHYQYGEEPRTYVIDENVTTTFVPTKEISVLSEQIPSGTANLQSPFPSAHSSNVVMGFSYVPHKIDYLINPKLKVLWLTVAEAKAGFLLDVGFGLRLPVRVDVLPPSLGSVSTPEGQYDFTTKITPLDFSAQDYEKLGIPAENGHEFFARADLFLGFKLWFLEVPVVNLAIDKNVDVGNYCSVETGVDCQDFVTPFGTDENGIPRDFHLPPILLSPNDTGLQLNLHAISLGLGLKIDPQLGSDKITADWTYTGRSSAKGQVTYVGSSPMQFSFGQVPAGDFHVGYGNTGPESMILDNYRFYLNRQIIMVLGNLQLDFFGHKVYETSYKKLHEFNLSSIFGEPSLGQHKGTQGVLVSWNPSAMPLAVANNTIAKPEVIKMAGSNMTSLTVSTDKRAYVTGETIAISGHIDQKGQPTLLQVFNSKGAAYRFDVIPALTLDPDGMYTYYLKVGGKIGIPGTYRIILTQGDQRAETTFSFNAADSFVPSITIPSGASVQGNIAFQPTDLTIMKGAIFVVINSDNVPHTVTSGLDPNDVNSGHSFDSGIINPGARAQLSTTGLAGNYQYYCQVHPYMKGDITVG